MGILKKMTRAAHNRTTYRLGLLQAKAYRILKDQTGAALKAHDVSTVEWAFLGVLFDAKAIRPKAAADEIGVEAPFVTAMFAKLEKKGLVGQKADPEDSRAKILFLTEKGKSFVEETEPNVRAHMRPLISGSSAGDILGYVALLEAIIKNTEKKETK